MKKTLKRRGFRKLQLTISWRNDSEYLEWLAKLERILRQQPRAVQIDFLGTGEISPDTALLIRAALIARSSETRVITNARSSIQGSAVMIWLP